MARGRGRGSGRPSRKDLFKKPPLTEADLESDEELVPEAAPSQRQRPMQQRANSGGKSGAPVTRPAPALEKSKEEMKVEMERLALVRKRREEERLKRIQQEGFDRYAPPGAGGRPTVS
eukprot:jgi/Mesvir1/21347/Mv20837-RA.1